jgi:hypothetical protein
MNLMIVTYDALNDDDGEHGKAILKYIKARREWAQASQSSYLVWTSKTTATIVAELKKSTNGNVSCFACPVGDPIAKTKLPQEAAELLKRRLD